MVFQVTDCRCQPVCGNFHVGIEQNDILMIQLCQSLVITFRKAIIFIQRPPELVDEDFRKAGRGRRIGEKCIKESRLKYDRVVDVNEKQVKKERPQVLRKRRRQLRPELLLIRKELLDNPEVADSVV